MEDAVGSRTPRREGPSRSPASSSPITAGCRKRSATSPRILADSSITATMPSTCVTDSAPALTSVSSLRLLEESRLGPHQRGCQSETMRVAFPAALSRVAIVALLCAGCSPVYVVRAGIEEAKILSRRRPIVDVLKDPATDARTRARLDLVLQARSFAQHELGLNTGESFTTYSWVDSDTLLMVLSAARKDKFEQYSWWFPIVGRVPYKGFFNFEEAYATATDLEQQGYDAYVRPSGAFSTLDWF